MREAITSIINRISSSFDLLTQTASHSFTDPEPLADLDTPIKKIGFMQQQADVIATLLKEIRAAYPIIHDEHAIQVLQTMYTGLTQRCDRLITTLTNKIATATEKDLLTWRNAIEQLKKIQKLLTDFAAHYIVFDTTKEMLEELARNGGFPDKRHAKEFLNGFDPLVLNQLTTTDVQTALQNGEHITIFDATNTVMGRLIHDGMLSIEKVDLDALSERDLYIYQQNVVEPSWRPQRTWVLLKKHQEELSPFISRAEIAQLTILQRHILLFYHDIAIHLCFKNKLLTLEAFFSLTHAERNAMCGYAESLPFVIQHNLLSFTELMHLSAEQSAPCDSSPREKALRSCGHIQEIIAENFATTEEIKAYFTTLGAEERIQFFCSSKACDIHAILKKQFCCFQDLMSLNETILNEIETFLPQIIPYVQKNNITFSEVCKNGADKIAELIDRAIKAPRHADSTSASFSFSVGCNNEPSAQSTAHILS